MAQAFVAVGAGIFLVLGLAHGALTLGDLRRPRAFTPTDERVRDAMLGARLALHPRANLWRAWLGFNLSHSLGLIVFGGTLLAGASSFFPVFSGSAVLQAATVAIATAYFVLAIGFWFWVPVLGTGVGLLLLLVGAVLSSV